MNGEILKCEKCGRNCLKKGATQKYCPLCSAVEHRKTQRRAAKWAHLSPEKRQEKEERRKKLQALVLAARSIEGKASITWAAHETDLLWLLRVAIPFTYSLSKNAIWRMRGMGHVYLREDAKIARGAITNLFRRALVAAKQRVAQNKLWVDILVQKADHKGDASNFVDSIFDGVKEATGLDDRWYSIRRVDWEIVKQDPRIFIGIGQESATDVQACSLCGGLFEYSNFAKNRSNKNGIARECLACRRAKGKSERQLALPVEAA